MAGCVKIQYLFGDKKEDFFVKYGSREAFEKIPISESPITLGELNGYLNAGGIASRDAVKKVRGLVGALNEIENLESQINALTAYADPKGMFLILEKGDCPKNFSCAGRCQ